MIPEYKERIALRLSKEDRLRIEELVKQEKFNSISHVIRQALFEFLKKNDRGLIPIYEQSRTAL
jgi:Arc/MetJ-type ribon-helix-helix transcriptional regulator